MPHVEARAEAKEVPQEFRVALLIGNGSRVPNLLDQLSYDPGIKVTQVISHRKPKEGQEDTVGIAAARRRGIPATYFNMIQMRDQYQRAFGEISSENFRDLYEQQLGAFVFQRQYKPDAVIATGWDLILKNFLRVAQANNAKVLNTHPDYLPDTTEPQDVVVDPNGRQRAPIRGLNVWERAVERGDRWSGVTVHEMIPGDPDKGKVHARVWVPIRGQNADQLRERLNRVEDLVVPQVVFNLVREHRGNSRQPFLQA
jgi:folate-dependent phosphoribosylglycinamide formyltransferase PurN